MTIEEKITRAKADYDAVYEAGKSQGGGKPTLYGTYAIKEDAMGGDDFTSENFDGKGVNAYFYDPRIKEYVNLEIADFYIGNSFEGVYWKTAFDGNGLCLTTDLYYASQEWTSSVRDIGDSKIESAPLPDAKGRLVIFSEPTVVSEKFYNLFKAISDTSEDIFGEGYDKAYGEVEYLNDELATSLYGGDTGYKGYYDELWDGLQNYGNRRNYDYAFSEWRGVKKIMSKYPIITASLYSLCASCSNLQKITSDIFYDDKGFTNIYSAFNGCTKLEEINFDIVMNNSSANINILNSAFHNCQSLKTIKKIVLDGVAYVYSNTFTYCKSLENLVIEGEIISTGLNLQWSIKLSKASITSIINALSTTTSSLSVTLSKTAVESAFGSTTSAEWTSLIGTRPNWTISLV